MAVYIDRLRLMDAITGEEITHIDLTEPFRARFRNPYAVVHRGDLHGVFLKACRDNPAIELRVKSEVVSYAQDEAGVTARLASGEAVTGALLVGADGLWSNVRRQVVGDGPPRVSGHTTYRSVIPTERMPEDLRWNAATLWAGPKCHIVHYPLSGWKVFNLVVTYHNDAPEPVAGKPVSEEEVMQGFGHVHERARKIIRHGSDWRLWVLCDREPVERWVDGRTVAPRRRRPSDAAVLRARRLHGARGRGLPVAHAVVVRRARAGARGLPAPSGWCGPPASSSSRGRSASTSTTRPARTRRSATRSCGRRPRRTITATSPGSTAAPGSRACFEVFIGPRFAFLILRCEPRT